MNKKVCEQLMLVKYYAKKDVLRIIQTVKIRESNYLKFDSIVSNTVV